jgi:hypothetical protein
MTGHVSPQFDVVFDDDFTTVQYLCTGTVSPHWADLVHSSAMIRMYTEKQVGTWQSIPNLEIEKGNFSGKNQPLSTSTQDRKQVGDSTALSNHSEQWVSFADQPGIENKINNPIAASNSSQNLWHMPTPINLDSSGLPCSSRTEVLNRCGKVYSNTTTLMNQDTHLRLAGPQTTHLLGKPTQFQICPGAILYYLFFWKWIVMYGSLSTGKSYHNFNINIFECHQQLPLCKHTLQWNNKLLLNVSPIKYGIKQGFLIQPSS